MDRDYIIVGQGLAGSVLALTLMSKGATVMVINQTNPNSSSMVAGGLYNPITGKEMKVTWLAERLFPALHSFYTKAEELTGAIFLHPMPIYRPFLSVQEQNDWMAKSAEPKYSAFVEAIFSTSQYGTHLHDSYGGILLKQGGFLDVPVFLEACKKYLLEQGAYMEDIFQNDDLILGTDQVNYRKITAGRIIYCNGLAVLDSPYFEWLPFRPVKGEILQGAFSKPHNIIFNRGVFVLPYKGNMSKVGATYNWQDLSNEPTEKARMELLEKLDKLMAIPFDIVEQKTGIRPATKDRRPFVGLHPTQKLLGIFNGFGAKGVSLAPYFAEQLAMCMEQKTAIDHEVNINRCFF